MPRFDASLTNSGIGRVDEDDHRAGGLLHDLLDQGESVIGALAEPYEGHVRTLPGGDRTHVVDLDLTGDHLMPEGGDYGCYEG